MARRRRLSRSTFHLGVLLGALVLESTMAVGAESAPTGRQGPIFRFQTDAFWLNLHHFLYVLGRAEAKTTDSLRRAVAGAPADQERGLANLPVAQQQLWSEAVSSYARGPSRLDAVFDEELFTAARKLADAEDAPDGVDLDSSWVSALEQAAPIYRRAWWPEHQAANRTWVEATEPLLATHGKPVLDFVTRAFGLPWPIDGLAVQVCSYGNWAGAYSTAGELLVISSLDEELRGTTVGLETLFHEAMHQWDEVQFAALVAAAKAQNVQFPRGLAHAMLFFTAGEALRTVIPEHVPYADRYGIWQRRSGVFLPMLEETWRPYLHGVVSRDQALAELMLHFAEPAPR